MPPLNLPWSPRIETGGAFCVDTTGAEVRVISEFEETLV
jgi:hypothetical protein